MDRQAVLKQIELYQQATNRQEQNHLLSQIGISAEIFTPRELLQIARQGGKLSEQQRQLVLGYIEVYFNLDLSSAKFLS